MTGRNGQTDGAETVCLKFEYAGIHPNGYSRLCQCGLKYDEHRPEAQAAESSEWTPAIGYTTHRSPGEWAAMSGEARWIELESSGRIGTRPAA